MKTESPRSWFTSSAFVAQKVVSVGIITPVKLFVRGNQFELLGP
jgi:hypothetical protein